MSRILCSVVAILVGCGWPLSASAATITINNGLAPPNPANVLDASNTSASDVFVVANDGCGGGDVPTCEEPGSPTTVDLATGAVVDTIASHQTSSIRIAGGTASFVLGRDESNIEITSGAVQSMALLEGAAGGISGGSLAAIEVVGAALTVQGGVIGSVLVYREGALTIFGTGFSVDGVEVALGFLEALNGELRGTLASGEPLSMRFTRRTFSEGDGAILLVPEPTSILLLSSGLVILARYPRARLARSS